LVEELDPPRPVVESRRSVEEQIISPIVVRIRGRADHDIALPGKNFPREAVEKEIGVEK